VQLSNQALGYVLRVGIASRSYQFPGFGDGGPGTLDDE
jgi:hypothetical protein